MAKTFRIGVLGLTHDHVWGNLKDLQATGRGVLVAAADPNPPLLDRAKREHGCAIHTDYERLLEREQLDAVYVFSDNATGARLAELAAGADCTSWSRSRWPPACKGPTACWPRRERAECA